MDAVQRRRLGKLAEIHQGHDRPIAIDAGDLLALVRESGTDEPGLAKAAAELADHRGNVFVPASLILPLIVDSDTSDVFEEAPHA